MFFICFVILVEILILVVLICLFFDIILVMLGLLNIRLFIIIKNMISKIDNINGVFFIVVFFVYEIKVGGDNS